ncbi:MAG TPA: non-reducing end alpha-L-arabinofuranosidase family hydrolase [bacterium]|nr:non-reducing end alpha-L-arabinofuranosidase family hydrolase [bacterium]
MNISRGSRMTLVLAGFLAPSMPGLAFGNEAAHSVFSGGFAWEVSAPLIGPASGTEDFYYSIKDPSAVYYNSVWHLFCTVRGQKRPHQIEYLTFPDWDHSAQAVRRFLQITDGYYCAPQIFYFAPQQTWYLIYQTSDPARKPELQPAFSTTKTLDDPLSWSPPVMLYDTNPPPVDMWIDFWVIGDEDKMYLFFTSLNGKMWRAETRLEDFPHGWSQPVLALEADIFEAGHIYRIQGEELYLAVIEAQRGSRRYYKAYTADRLDGKWLPLADTYEKPFASPANVKDSGLHWADSISHGEILRAGYNHRLMIDPGNLVFLFQGVLDQEMAGKKYGEIPWRLGLLTPVQPSF